MSSRCLSLAAVLLAACAAANARELRVCADPNNLPFSNSRSEGFENKVAELVARELGAKLQYTWWAQRRAFVRNSLGNGACDVIMGLPPDYPSVLTTEPWYRSTYVLLSRDLPVKSLYDPALRTARIGVHVVGEDYAPPAQELARRGIVNNFVGYSLFGANGEANPPAKLVDAVVNGDVDVAIIWGPFAGYFTKNQPVALHIVPVPFEFSIAAAVRPGDERLKADIDRVLSEHREEIGRILRQYGVPLCGNTTAPFSASR